MLDKIIHRWLRIPYTLNVHYFSRPEKPKATILLIHGLGTSWKTWMPLEPYLPKGARVIAIDMLGFGNSPKPDWKSYNVHDQAASIVATLRREFINNVDIVIGHSMGSLAAKMRRRFRRSACNLFFGNIPLTASSIIRSGWRSRISLNCVSLIPPGKPLWR
jgi:cis-3-alkyl-4-acyloxetan-2-one decarboxylase